MSLLQNIIDDSEPNAQKAAYMIEIIRKLGWESFVDGRTIKPDIRKTYTYVRKKYNTLSKLFGPIFNHVKIEDLVDVINPLLIEIWHVQIIGGPDAAKLEFLTKM